MLNKENNFKYLVKNHVLVKHEWEEKPDELIQAITFNNKLKCNYITKVVKINSDEKVFIHQKLKEDDIVFVSRYVTSKKKHKLGGLLSTEEYSHLPLPQVLGAFRDNKISFDNIEIFDDKILVEKITTFKQNDIFLSNLRECNIGRVVKHGHGGFFKDFTRKSNSMVNVGDVILFWDNVSTPLTLDGKHYLCMEDNRIIGKLSNIETELKLENLTSFNGKILLKDIEDDKADITGKIVLSKGTFDNSTVNNRLVVVSVGGNEETRKNVYSDMTVLKVDDVVVVDRDYTEYVDFLGVRYYTTDLECIECIIR
jgi:co-chaperonin GroES (HSP10)